MAARPRGQGLSTGGKTISGAGGCEHDWRMIALNLNPNRVWRQ
jgi:hypothetical protein